MGISPVNKMVEPSLKIRIMSGQCHHGVARLWNDTVDIFKEKVVNLFPTKWVKMPLCTSFMSLIVQIKREDTIGEGFYRLFKSIILYCITRVTGFRSSQSRQRHNEWVKKNKFSLSQPRSEHCLLSNAATPIQMTPQGHLHEISKAIAALAAANITAPYVCC